MAWSALGRPSVSRRITEALLTLVLSYAVAAFVQDNADALTRDGALRGFRRQALNASIDIYLGVPYAHPPVGELRLSKPQRPSNWTGVRDATWFGPACPQMTGGRLVGHEDCLYLNVYAPSLNASSGGFGLPPKPQRAVMVFIHGGSFVSGSASEYDPTVLALAGDVVVVTINYRLGMLGYLRIDGPGEGQVRGNFGLWDQRMAVEWVQQNAAAFGGDPLALTVFGESAGARSVSLLALSPVANGLFQRVIAESGSGSAVRSTYRNTARTTSEALARLNVSAAASAAEALSRLRQLNLSTLVSVGSDPSSEWSPVIDGDFLPEDVDKLWSRSGFRRLQYLSGYNSQEGLLFLGAALAPVAAQLGIRSLQSGINQTVLDAVFESQLRAIIPGDTTTSAMARRVYCSCPEGSCADDYRRLAIAADFVGDNLYAAPITELANERAASEYTNATYVYYLDRKRLVNVASPATPKWLRTGALHTDDLPLVFGGSTLYALNEEENVTSTVDLTFPFAFWYGDSTETELSSIVIRYWTNFAKTGNPNQPNPVTMAWPPYTTSNTSIMFFDYNGTRVLPGYVHKCRLDLWHDVVLPKFRSSRDRTTPPSDNAGCCFKTLSCRILLYVTCAVFWILGK